MKHNKLTLNITTENRAKLNELKKRFPFATDHALASLALSVGLDAAPEHLAARWVRNRNQEKAA